MPQMRRNKDVDLQADARQDEDFNADVAQVNENLVNLLGGGGSGARVLYSIQTAAQNLEAVQAAFDTWASDLAPGQVQVIGMNQPKQWRVKGVHWEKTSCPDTHDGGACKDFTALAHAWEADADWVVLLGADNYAVAKNIEAALASQSPSTPQVLGIRGCGKCSAGGLCGGGGQIFSRAALKQMIGLGRDAYMTESMHEAKACGYWGDVSNCRVAAAHHVPVKDLPGLNGWEMDDSELQQSLTSPYPAPLTFHYLTADRIRAVHAMVMAAEGALLESVSGAQAQGMARWAAQRDRYVAEERARRKG